MPYTSVNGHMFSFLAKDGSMALRLPVNETEKFIKKHKSKLCGANGTILKEYVAIPHKLFNDETQMTAYFKASFEYVSSLKPKPTTKTTLDTKTTKSQKSAISNRSYKSQSNSPTNPL